MDLSETARLLAAIRVIDERLLINEVTVQTWFALLPMHLELEDALQAVKDHYQRTNSRIMPSDVINACKSKRKTATIITCDQCEGTGIITSTEIRNGMEYHFGRYCDCQHNTGE